MLEVLVSLTILVVGFLLVVGLFSTNLQLIHRSKENAEATEIGRDFLEEVLDDPSMVPDPPLTFDPDAAPVGSFPPAPFPLIVGEHANYRLTVRVTAGPHADLKSVEVRVAWDSEGGGGVDLQTFVEDYN